MFFTIFVVFYLGSVVQSTQGSPKSRCAVVIFVNQSSFNSEEDFSDYVENIRGLSSNLTSVYFTEEPDLFKVKHGSFIDAPGLFALESQRFPGKFLRRTNHTIVLEDKQSTEDFKNDATFLMDNAKKNETYTTLKLFSHRSWRLSSTVSTNSSLYFDDYEDNISPSRSSELLVVAQPCPHNDKERQQGLAIRLALSSSFVLLSAAASQVIKSSKPSKPKSNVESEKNESGLTSGHIFRDVTVKPPTHAIDATLNATTDTKYWTGSRSTHIFRDVKEKSFAVSTDPSLNETTDTKYLTGSRSNGKSKDRKVTVKPLPSTNPNLKGTTDTKYLIGSRSGDSTLNRTTNTKYLTGSRTGHKFRDVTAKPYSLQTDQILNRNTDTKYLSGLTSRHSFRDVTEKPPTLPTDPTLNGNGDTKYLTAMTNKGTLKIIPNEYSFDDFTVPDFIMNSLVENAKSASDGVEAPKPEAKPATVMENINTPQQSITEHTNKPATTKQKIGGGDLYSLLDDPDLEDIEDNLKDLQYGSKGCKLLVAEDAMDEEAASKDTVARPKIKKVCIDEFPEACGEMAKKGYCLAFKSLMSSVCRKSCNLCSRMLDTGFTSCTKTCGGGRQMRMIKINRREYLQTRRCNRNPCPINGGYSDFGPYTECSVTCGQGVQYRRRTCTKPRPQYNGISCRRLGPSIESKRCHTELCPGRNKKTNKEKTRKITNSHHHKAALHIDGPHSNKVHQHSILLEGRKVAKLRCTPRRGALRSIIQDSPTKRFTVHRLKNIDSSKRSSIEESQVVYNKEGLPVDTARTVVNAFKSPYKIILRRKGANDMKLLEECLQVDDKLGEENDVGKHHKGDLVYTRPDEKSYSDFDEYKYETGNVITPQVTTSHDSEDHDYSTPNEKLFAETKGLDFVLSKMNSISPRVNDQLSQEQNLESSFRPENAHPVDGWTFTAPEVSNERGDETNTDKDNYGYNVETMPDR